MAINLPTFIIGAVLATLYGALFHLWRGGRAGRLLLYLLLAWIGFWGGQFLASFVGLSLFKVGGLQLGAATAGSVLLMLVGYWLSPVRRAEE